MSAESDYDQLLALLRKANLDYAKLADWLLQPENRPAYNAVPKLKPTTRNMLLPFLSAAIEQRRASGLPLPKDEEFPLWKHIVFHIEVKKQTVFFIFVQRLQQLSLAASVMESLDAALSTTIGVAHCDAAEDTIAISLTGQLSADDAARMIANVLRSFLGEQGYIVEVDIS